MRMMVEVKRVTAYQPPNRFRLQSRNFRAEFLTIAIADLRGSFASIDEIRQIEAKIQELFLFGYAERLV
jgi:hypothetical protein